MKKDCTLANKDGICRGFKDARGESGGWHTRLPGHPCDYVDQKKCAGYTTSTEQTKKAQP